MTLPGDVAVRTTSYQGSRVALLYEVWSGWVAALPEDGIVASAMLDCADDFAAAIFNLVHGFYKQSVVSLRSALEIVVLASYCELARDAAMWGDWRRGKEFRFGRVCRALAELPAVRGMEEPARQASGSSLFLNPADPESSSWTRSLYSRLCRFVHATEASANATVWGSNGPVYSADGMRMGYRSFLETSAQLLILATIAIPDFELPAETAVLYQAESLPRYLPVAFRPLCAHYAAQLFRDAAEVSEGDSRGL
jgi:hypothetical protein